MAAAHHAEFASPMHDATELEIVVGLRDRAGTPINGYGWMFPTGTGTVDIGVALMSTSPSFQVLNPAHVLDAVVAEHRDRWHLDGTPIAPPSGGRIPLGRSVGPAAGPTWLLLGDAVAAADPWSGAGIHGAIRTGAIAGDVLAEALRTGSAASLQRYPRALEDELGDGYGVGRIVNRLMGHPTVSTRVARTAARSRSSADTYLRLGTGAIRTGHVGPAELVYRIARGVGAFIPGA
jgi:flavin-dependent dehydrogenase